MRSRGRPLVVVQHDEGHPTRCERVRAELLEVSLVTVPAYREARVLHADAIPSKTPNLAAVMASMLDVA